LRRPTLSQGPALESAAVDTGSFPTVEWTYNPWVHVRGRRHPALALLVLVGAAALAGYSFTAPQWWPASLAWGGLALLLLLGMTANTFLPARYRLDERGISTWFLGAPSFRPWSHYRNYYVHDTGAHLTTMPDPSPLDPFRGHMLMFAGNREAVVAALRAGLPQARRAGAGSSEAQSAAAGLAPGEAEQ
jgi:hypothetical protein